MPPCQSPRLTDTARVSAANDNYTPLKRTMKSFETGSILDPRDYNAPTKMNQIVLSVTAIFCALALAVYIIRLGI
jgi:hypothetical protein